VQRVPTNRWPAGFTLVELVAVIVLLGVLSAVIAPKLTRSGVDGRNFVDRSFNSIRFAQKLAIAQRRTTYVCIGASSLAVGFSTGCAAPASDPGGGTISFTSTAVSMTPLEFSFDAQGRVAAQHDIVINVPDTSDSYTLRVEANTGYVHTQP
jgi:MSHA pilin protein MshC